MKTAFVFTGQGSQFAGMGKDVCSAFPAAAATLQEAGEALGMDLAKLCFEGPEDQLALTTNTQPCTLAVSVAAYRALGRQPDVAAGHSLGEYSALCAAGAFELGVALRLVRERAQRMQNAVPVGTGGMVALLKVTPEEARQICAEVESGVCEIANVNSPGQVVLAGAAKAMDEVVRKVGERRARRLAVSVPFHCSLLKEAAAGFAAVLEKTPMQDPAFPIWCNVDAKPVTTAKQAKDALARQFAGSVLWQTSVENMIRDGGVERFVELGPKPTLTRMVAQIAAGIGATGVSAVSAVTAAELQALR
jgi:[acyl-carrier-protein] S-malonyltransferase